MKKISIYLSALLLIMTLLALNSCTDIDEGEIPLGEGESIVEMSFFTSSPTTRSLTEGKIKEIKEGTEEENTIKTLDILVFDNNNNFLYRRPAARQSDVGNTFRATLKVGVDLSVYFLVNARKIVDDLVTDGKLYNHEEDKPANFPASLTWEDTRKMLIDSDPGRFDPNRSVTELDNLPMWGRKFNVEVTENIITHWTGINLMRAVAGVDVYMADAVATNSDFVLQGAYLFFIPNKGYLAPSEGNYDGSTGTVAESESAPEMETLAAAESGKQHFGLVAAQKDADIGYTKIANKFYLYDNDTDKNTFDKDTRRYTRVVVQGTYKTVQYFYPIDFLVEKTETIDGKDVVTGIDYDQITRNTKYIFEITGVSGPGYTDLDVASKEPPVHMTTHIHVWDVRTDTEFGYDGLYYVSLERKEAVLSRAAESTDYIKFTSNAKPEVITVKMVDVDGEEVASTDIENGKKTEWFSVVKGLNGDKTAVTQLEITALQDYSAGNNIAYALVQAGNVKFQITITQIDGSSSDWELGEDIKVDIEGKK